jgi:hypothetical protein
MHETDVDSSALDVRNLTIDLIKCLMTKFL